MLLYLIYIIIETLFAIFIILIVMIRVRYRQCFPTGEFVRIIHKQQVI
jgi:hypothetical protein